MKLRITPCLRIGQVPSDSSSCLAVQLSLPEYLYRGLECLASFWGRFDEHKHIVEFGRVARAAVEQLITKGLLNHQTEWAANAWDGAHRIQIADVDPEIHEVLLSKTHPASLGPSLVSRQRGKPAGCKVTMIMNDGNATLPRQWIV
jgi:hypothetical protein